MKPRRATPPAALVHGADRSLPPGTGMLVTGVASLLLWGVVAGIAAIV